MNYIKKSLLIKMIQLINSFMKDNELIFLINFYNRFKI